MPKHSNMMLSPPGKPGIDENNPVQMRLVMEQKDHLIQRLTEQKQEMTDRVAQLLIELQHYRKVAFALGKTGDFTSRPLEESILEIAHLFANKYPEEEHPIVVNMLRMIVKEVESKLRGEEQEDEPDAEPSGSNY